MSEQDEEDRQFVGWVDHGTKCPECGEEMSVIWRADFPINKCMYCGYPS